MNQVSSSQITKTSITKHNIRRGGLRAHYSLKTSQKPSAKDTSKINNLLTNEVRCTVVELKASHNYNK